MVSTKLNTSGVEKAGPSFQKCVKKISFRREYSSRHQSYQRNMLEKENLVNLNVKEILSTIKEFQSSNSHDKLISLCEKYLHLFSGLRFNINKMAPTGYRLYLHSSRLPGSSNKYLPRWSNLGHSRQQKFLKQASLLSELHSIICETLQIAPGNSDKQPIEKVVKKPTPKKPVKRQPKPPKPSTTMSTDDWNWRPTARTAPRRKGKSKGDGINFLRLRSRSLQRPKRPLRTTQPKKLSCCGSDRQCSVYGSRDSSIEHIDPNLDFANPNSPRPANKPSGNLSGIWISPDVTNDASSSNSQETVPWRVPGGCKNCTPQKVLEDKASAPILFTDPLESLPFSEETDTCSEEETAPPIPRENYMPLKNRSLEGLGYLLFDMGLSEEQHEEISVCRINLELKMPPTYGIDFSSFEYFGNMDYAMGCDNDVEMREVSSNWINSHYPETSGNLSNSTQKACNVETNTQGTQTDICVEIISKANDKKIKSQETQTHFSDSSDDDDDDDDGNKLDRNRPRVTNIPVIKLGCAKTINWNANLGICKDVPSSTITSKLDSVANDVDKAVIVLSIDSSDVDMEISNDMELDCSSSVSSSSPQKNISNKADSLSSGIHSQSSFSEENIDLNCSEEMLETETSFVTIEIPMCNLTENQSSKQKNPKEALTVPIDPPPPDGNENTCFEKYQDLLPTCTESSTQGIRDEDYNFFSAFIDEVLNSNPLKYIPT